MAVNGVPHRTDAMPAAHTHAYWPLVERIAESRHFRKSPRSRELLFFITERMLQGQNDELTEQNIGCAVFGRPPEYKPAEDNIVRVSMRQLRSKLKDYFDTDGLEEEITLDLPKGSGAYIPVFKPAARPPLAPVNRTPGRLPVWVAAATSILAVIGLTGTGWFWHENQSLKAAGAASPQSTLVAELLLKSNQPVTVVMSDFGLILMDGISGHFIQLEDYAGRGYLAAHPPLKDPALSRLWQTLTSQQITSFGDITLVSRLLKTHPAGRNQFLIRHAREMGSRDFKTGQFILLGGFLSTPWASLFEQRCNFRLEMPDAVLRNVRPKPGERPAYGPVARGDKGETSYGHIALLPNLSNTGKVLLVAGLNAAATEASAEFLLSPLSVPVVKRSLGVTDLSAIGSFEIVLETSALGGAGNGARIVAFRR